MMMSICTNVQIWKPTIKCRTKKKEKKNVDRINITNCIYISLLTIDITKKKEKKLN